MAVSTGLRAASGPAASSTAVSRALSRVGVVLAAAALAVFLVAAIAPSWLTSSGPTEIDFDAVLQPPSWAHPLGTDESGRDLLTRIVYGTRDSLLIGLGATVVAALVATVIGLVGGLGGRRADQVVGRGLDVLFAFPVLLMALLVVSVYGPGKTTQIVAVGLGTAPGYARLVRGQLLAVRDSAYVEAAVTLGVSRAAVIRRHLLPNAFRPLVVVVALGVGQAIVWASSLSFLGLGVAPPSPEWGALLDAGRDSITDAWWLEVAPGVAIVAFALATTTVGRYLQHPRGTR